MKEEIIRRIAALLISGFTIKQAKDKLIRGDIANQEFTEKLADKYVKEAIELLDTDVGEDQKLQYSRLVHLYNLCLDKKDYANALKAWKEINEFRGGVQDKQITIKFIK